MRGSSAIYLPSDRNDCFLLSIANGVVISQNGPRQTLPHSVRCPIESKLDGVRVVVVTPSVRLEASATLFLVLTCYRTQRWHSHSITISIRPLINALMVTAFPSPWAHLAGLYRRRPKAPTAMSAPSEPPCTIGYVANRMTKQDAIPDQHQMTSASRASRWPPDWTRLVL
jgi:hypothetical protein